MKKVLLASSLLLAFTVQMTSCVKKDFDTPPDNSSYDPHLEVTHTIAQMKAMPLNTKIDTDAVIYGIVSMDDRSGNYYKKIVIQDSTGGIEILIDQNNLYNDFPVGRKVYVKLKGLYLGAYNENPQLGATPDNAGSLSNIPFVEVDNYIVKANYPNPVVPDTFTLEELQNPANAANRINTLVAIRDVEFVDDAVDVPFAEISSLASATSLNFKNCNDARMILRTSGFAKFQPVKTPGGRGTIVGIYTRFRNTPQLYIRDTSDVHFTNPIRCNGSEYAPPVLVSIDSLRNYYQGSDVTVPSMKIRGVVISDVSNGNITSGNLILQESSTGKGIAVYYGGSLNYAMGDSLEINVTGTTLKNFQGKLEVSGARVNKTIKLATNVAITPRTLTINAINNDIENLESTLVKIENITWQAGAMYYNGTAGNLNISDATGTILQYTAGGASFKNTLLPPAPVTSVTGFLEVFNGTIQFRIRNLNDVVAN